MSHAETRETVTLNSQGNQIFGMFHAPVGLENVPAVLMCHGFAGTKVGRFRMYVRLAEALAHAGIASLRIDFRGCGDSEGNFLDTTFEGQVQDALKGLDFLDNHSLIDSTRIGLLGRSLGGPVAVVAARQYGRIRSLALWAAVFHADPWRKHWEQAHKERAALPTPQPPLLFQGNPTNPQLFLQLLQLNMDKELNALRETPLFCVHSESDEVVDMGHADRFRVSREEAEAHSHFMKLQKSSHDFSDHFEQDDTIYETVKWYKQTLKEGAPLLQKV